MTPDVQCFPVPALAGLPDPRCTVAQPRRAARSRGRLLVGRGDPLSAARPRRDRRYLRPGGTVRQPRRRERARVARRPHIQPRVILPAVSLSRISPPRGDEYPHEVTAGSMSAHALPLFAVPR
ncbi:hypothetical protein BRC70_01495 [Halobacteriales archaeon QH_6_68_27]|nr:MAG: hypothetical protein BRC70_01495 [Halobacteriales archaeon QH_6_68_27]